MLQFIDYVLRCIVHHLPIIIITLLALTVLYGILVRFLKINQTNPLFQAIIDLLGLHFLNNSQIALEFHAYINLISNYKNRFIIAIKPDDLECFLVPSSQQGDKYQKLNWVILNDTIILNITRSFLFTNDWQTLIKFIHTYRASQPVNAVLLGINFNEDLDMKLIAKRLGIINGCTYPIYMIITNLGTILDKDLMIGALDNIIVGWSADQMPDKSIYSPTKVIGLVNYISKHIVKTLDNLIPNETCPKLIISNYKMFESLNYQLKSITDLFYNHFSFFLRGVYLTNLYINDRSLMDNLLYGLICHENLATRSNKPKNRYLTLINHALLVLLFILFFSLPFIYHSITLRSSILKTSIDGINTLSVNRGQNLSSIIQKLAFYLSNIGTHPMNFITIPASWTDRSYSQTRKALIHAYYNLLIKQLFEIFNTTVHDTIKNVYKYSKPPFTSIVAIDTKELHDLYYFIKHMINLKDTQKLITNMVQFSDINYFNELVTRYCYHKLPQEFFDHKDLYSSVWKMPMPSFEKIENYNNVFQQILYSKAQVFLDSLPDESQVFQKINNIVNQLNAIQANPHSCTSNNLIMLRNLIVDIKTTLKNSEWINQDNFIPSEQFSDIGIKMQEGFDKVTSDKIMSKLNIGIISLKQKLLSTRIPIYNQIIESPHDLTKINPDLEILMAIVDTLNNKGLLKENDNTISIATKVSNSSLRWNIPNLTTIVQNINEINSILNNQVNLLSLEGKLYFKPVIINIINKQIEASIISSLHINLPDPTNDPLKMEIQNISEAINQLILIIDFLQSTNSNMIDAMKHIIQNQSEQILTKLYKEMMDSNIYSINANSLLNSITNDKVAYDFIKSSRDRIQSYYNKVQKLLDILSTLYTKHKDMQPTQGYQTWNLIHEYLSPNTNIALETLDHYIISLLKTRTIPELARIRNSSPKIPGSDFVPNRIMQINSIIDIKINTGIIDEVKNLYNLLKTNFDNNLNGHFPFAPLSAPDIEKPQFMRFYIFWQNNKQKFTDILELFKNNSGINNTQWYVLFSQFTQAMRWIEAIAEPATFPITCVIKIRDKHNLEINTQHLAMWRLGLSMENEKSFILNNNSHDIVNKICDMNSSITINSITQTKLDMIQLIANTSNFTFAEHKNARSNGISIDGPFAILRFIQQYYDHQDNDMIYLKINYRLVNQKTKQNDYIVSWVSLKCAGVPYCKFPQAIPLFKK